MICVKQVLVRWIISKQMKQKYILPCLPLTSLMCRNKPYRCRMSASGLQFLEQNSCYLRICAMVGYSWRLINLIHLIRRLMAFSIGYRYPNSYHMNINQKHVLLDLEEQFKLIVHCYLFQRLIQYSPNKNNVFWDGIKYAKFILSQTKYDKLTVKSPIYSLILY